MQTQGKYLVVAWGNPDRCDDVAGLAIANSLAGEVAEDVEIRYVEHLGPELVDDVAAADHVLFINVHASPSWPELVVEEVEPAAVHSLGDRYEDPAELLTLSQVLYHRRPSAWLIATRVFDISAGGKLSPRGLKMVDAARRVLLSILPTAESRASMRTSPQS